MRIFSFPKTIKLDLPDFQREALDQILERQPQIQTDDDLLAQVLSRGIVSVLEDGKNLNEAETHPTRIERLKQRLNEMAAAVDGDSLSLDADLEEDGTPDSREFCGYAAAPIGENLTRRLNVYLQHHPELTEEDAVVRLLELGLEEAGAGRPALGTATKRAARRRILARLAQCSGSSRG